MIKLGCFSGLWILVQYAWNNNCTTVNCQVYKTKSLVGFISLFSVNPCSIKVYFYVYHALIRYCLKANTEYWACTHDCMQCDVYSHYFTWLARKDNLVVSSSMHLSTSNSGDCFIFNACIIYYYYLFNHKG